MTKRLFLVFASIIIASTFFISNDMAFSSSAKNTLSIKSTFGLSEKNGIIRMPSQDGAPFFPLFKQEVAFDSKGNLFVTDNGESQIEVFSPELKPLFNFGSIGSGDGQFQLLNGVSIDQNNHVYTIDTFLCRIQVFDLQGNFIRMFGEKGFQEGQLLAPTSIAFLNENEMLIADYKKGLKKFTIDGKFLDFFSEDERIIPRNENEGPVSITTDSNKNIFILYVDYQQRQSIIYSFDKNGNFQNIVLQSGRQEHNLPELCTHFHIDYPYLFVTGIDDYRGASVQMFSLSGSNQQKAEFLMNLASFPLAGRGIRESDVIVPTSVAGKNNRIYYIDGIFNKIICLDDKKNIHHIYHTDVFLYDLRQDEFFHYLSNPQGITINQDGLLLVINSNYGDLVIMDKDGTVHNRIKLRSDEQWSTKPADIIVDQRGFIYISDMLNHLVHVYDKEYNFMLSIDEGFSFPQGMALTQHQELLVVNSANSTVSKINIEHLDDDLGIHHADTYFVDGFWPVGISLNSTNDMVISVTGSNEIHILNEHGSYIRKFGKEGHLPGQLDAPQGVWVNQDDFIYVAETYNGRIQKFDMRGRLHWTSELQWPGLTFICKGPNDLLYATDCLHNLVLAFEYAALEKDETFSVVIKLQIGNHVVLINEKPYEIESPPFIDQASGRTLVPIRMIVEAIDANIDWSPVDQKITIESDNALIELWIGNPKARINGKETPIDEHESLSPLIINHRTFLPLRFVAEHLGFTVVWDPDSEIITLTYTKSKH